MVQVTIIEPHQDHDFSSKAGIRIGVETFQDCHQTDSSESRRSSIDSLPLHERPACRAFVSASRHRATGRLHRPGAGRHLRQALKETLASPSMQCAQDAYMVLVFVFTGSRWYMQTIACASRSTLRLWSIADFGRKFVRSSRPPKEEERDISLASMISSSE